MKTTAIQFVDENGIVHLYKTDKGLHYRTYPTDKQFIIEVFDKDGKVVASTQTKLEYKSDSDVEILEERDFYYLWYEEIPEYIGNFLSANETQNELIFKLNCVEEFLTEIIQANLDVVLEEVKEIYDERLK